VSGVYFVRLPLPPSQLDVPVTDEQGALIYVSRRARNCSGNAILSDGYGTGVLASKYQFGPSREPKIYVLNVAKEDEELNVVKTKSKWTSRRQEFVLSGGKSGFVWIYVKERDEYLFASEGKEKRRWYLVCEVPIPTSQLPSSPSTTPSKLHKKEVIRVRRIAELVRNHERRTPGTSSMDAGNGGELQIDCTFCESVGLREDIVVASCLMMLKKETDRQRMVQFAIIAGIAGGW
jgi:hypothetical protein